ncbi:MAG: hypothetical protein V1921_01980 [Candidatus Altiarchaeota archaeon]
MKRLHVRRKLRTILASAVLALILLAQNATALPILLLALIFIPLIGTGIGIAITKWPAGAKFLGFLLNIPIKLLVDLIVSIFGPFIRLVLNYIEDGIIYNPKIYPFDEICFGGLPTQGFVYGCAVENLMKMMMKILAPFYTLLLLLIGIYIIFVSVEPQSRARAKSEFNKLLISMLLASSAPVIYQLLLDISQSMTAAVFENSTTKTSEAMARGIIVAFANPWTFELGAWVVLFGLVLVMARLFFIVLFAILFPVSIFLYFFDFTRGLGSNMIRATMFFIFLQVVQALIFVITGIAAAEQASELLRGFIVAAGLTGMVLAGMLMAGIMKWAGGFMAMVGTSMAGRGQMGGAVMLGAGQIMMGAGPSGLVGAGATAGYMMPKQLEPGIKGVGRKALAGLGGAAGHPIQSMSDGMQEAGGGAAGVIKGFQRWGRTYVEGYKGRFSTRYTQVRESMAGVGSKYAGDLPSSDKVSEALKRSQQTGKGTGKGGTLPYEETSGPGATAEEKEFPRTPPARQKNYGAGATDEHSSLVASHTSGGRIESEGAFSNWPMVALMQSGFMPQMFSWMFWGTGKDEWRDKEYKKGFGRWSKGVSLRKAAKDMVKAGEDMIEQSRSLSVDEASKMRDEGRNLIRQGRRAKARGWVATGASVVMPASPFIPIREAGAIIAGTVSLFLPETVGLGVGGLALQLGVGGLSLVPAAAGWASRATGFGVSLLGGKGDTPEDIERRRMRVDKWDARADRMREWSRATRRGGGWVRDNAKFPMRKPFYWAARKMTGLSVKQIWHRSNVEQEFFRSMFKYRQAKKEHRMAKKSGDAEAEAKAEKRKASAEERVFKLLRKSSRGDEFWGKDEIHDTMIQSKVAQWAPELMDKYLESGSDSSLDKYFDEETSKNTADAEGVGFDKKELPGAQERQLPGAQERDTFEALLKEGGIGDAVGSEVNAQVGGVFNNESGGEWGGFERLTEFRPEDVLYGLTEADRDAQEKGKKSQQADALRLAVGLNQQVRAGTKDRDGKEMDRDKAKGIMKKFNSNIQSEEEQAKRQNSRFLERYAAKTENVTDTMGRYLNHKLARRHWVADKQRLLKYGSPKTRADILRSVHEEDRKTIEEKIARKHWVGIEAPKIQEIKSGGDAGKTVWDMKDEKIKKKQIRTEKGIDKFKERNINWDTGTVREFVTLDQEEAAVALHYEWGLDERTGAVRYNFHMMRSADGQNMYMNQGDYAKLMQRVEHEGGKIRVEHVTADDFVKMQETGRVSVQNQKTGRVEYFLGEDDANKYVISNTGIMVVGAGIADEKITRREGETEEAALVRAESRAEALRKNREKGAYLRVDDIQTLERKYGFSGEQVNRLVDVVGSMKEKVDVVGSMKEEYGLNPNTRVAFYYNPYDINPATTNGRDAIEINLGSRVFNPETDYWAGLTDEEKSARVLDLRGSKDLAGWNDLEAKRRWDLMQTYSAEDRQVVIDSIRSVTGKELSQEEAGRVLYNRNVREIGEGDAQVLYNRQQWLQKASTEDLSKSIGGVIFHEAAHIKLFTGASISSGQMIENQQDVYDVFIGPGKARSFMRMINPFSKSRKMGAGQTLMGGDRAEMLGQHKLIGNLPEVTEEFRKILERNKVKVKSEVIGNLFGETLSDQIGGRSAKASEREDFHRQQIGKAIEAKIDNYEDTIALATRGYTDPELIRQKASMTLTNKDAAELAMYRKRAELLGNKELAERIEELAKATLSEGERRRTYAGAYEALDYLTENVKFEKRENA